MAIETIRNPHTDQLLSPENSALIINDYQSIQVSSIRSMPRDELVFNIASAAKRRSTSAFCERLTLEGGDGWNEAVT